MDGTVLEVFYGEGDEVPVLDKMMIIGNPGEDYQDLLQEEQLEQGTKNKETENKELSYFNKVHLAVAVDTDHS